MIEDFSFQPWIDFSTRRIENETASLDFQRPPNGSVLITKMNAVVKPCKVDIGTNNCTYTCNSARILSEPQISPCVEYGRNRAI